MNTLLTPFRLADTAIVKITRIGVITCMALLFVLLMIRIIGRATETPFVALDEIGELTTVWMIFFGVIAMWRQGSLYSVEFLNATSNRLALFVNFLVQVVMLCFAVILVWQGYKFTMGNREMSPFLLIDMKYFYGAIPVCFGIMTVYSLFAVIERAQTVITGKSQTDTGEIDLDSSSGF